MILEQETYEKFGYDPRELKPRSRKNVLVKCDKCGIIREIRMDSYSDLCVSCSHLGQTPWNKGKKATEKAKKNQSLAHLGQPAWNKDVLWSEESKEKMSISHIGKTLSEDHKKSISAALEGHSVSEETRNKIKETQGWGEEHSNYRGGLKATHRRQKAKRRKLGFLSINEPFEGSEANHITTNFVVYIPTLIHRLRKHSVWSGKNMYEMGNLTINFLLGKIDFEGKEI